MHPLPEIPSRCAKPAGAATAPLVRPHPHQLSEFLRGREAGRFFAFHSRSADSSRLRPVFRQRPLARQRVISAPSSTVPAWLPPTLMTARGRGAGSSTTTGKAERIQAARRHLNGLPQDAPATFKIRQPCAELGLGGPEGKMTAEGHRPQDSPCAGGKERV
jgi:hypothetical protein